MYDLIIVGGGPAGATAAVYAARKQLKTAFVTSEWGGQSTVSTDIQNWIGTPHISGADLAKGFKAHVEEYAGEHVRIITPDSATSLSTTDTTVSVTLKSGETLKARALFIASGSKRRTLNIPGAAEYEHKGLTYCASCDGPLFAGQPVAVIGGGNAAFETALQLAAYCPSVTILNRSDVFRADEITVESARHNPAITIITNVTPVRVSGESFVTSITYTTSDGSETTLGVSGIFVEIGALANSDWTASVLHKTPNGHIIVDPRTQRTTMTDGTVSRIWAAGDITDGLYHQNNIASGDAVKALEDLYIFLQKNI